MQPIEDVWRQIRQVLNAELFTAGGSVFTAWTLIYLLALFVVLVALSNRLKTWLADRVLARRGVEVGVRQSVATLVRYTILAVGFVVILQSAGIDLSTLTVFAGALGIGIGFGLQNITSNFASGIIILFERPIKVGDRIDVRGVAGNVVNISARATTVITNDNVAIIVPNSLLVTEPVINWSFPTTDVRFDVPVDVSYGADPEQVRQVLLEVARAHPGVLTHPQPDVLLSDFGDSGVSFRLRVWTREYSIRPGVLRSDLNYAISKAFRTHGIEIPFPQRDLHIKGERLGVDTAGS